MITSEPWDMSETWAGLSSLCSHTSQSATGTLTLADLEDAWQSMYDHERACPDLIFVSPKDIRRIWRWTEIAALYARYPLPKRRLRKVTLRRRQALIEQGKRRIARDERDIYDRAPILPPYEG